MSTKRLIEKTAVMGACLVVIALTSGCGFLCTDDSDCQSNICRGFQCSESKDKIEDPAPPVEFTDPLEAIFPLAELQR